MHKSFVIRVSFFYLEIIQSVTVLNRHKLYQEFGAALTLPATDKVVVKFSSNQSAAYDANQSGQVGATPHN